MDRALDKIGPAADKVHNELDADERHQDNFYKHQQVTGKEHNDIIAHADEVLSKEEGPRQQQQPPGQVQGNIVAATVAAMQAANVNQGPKKIDYHLKPKILGKEFTTSELRTWCDGMTFFWAAQLMETRDKQVRWANVYDCIHGSLKSYYEPKMPRGVGICTPRNPGDPQADHRTALEIIQKDHQTRWPIHNRRVNLFKQEQKQDQSFNQWHIHLYGLGEEANIDKLTGRDWLLFILIQSCKSQELKKKIFDLDDDEVTLPNVLALAKGLR
jgi:hypothetical protein